jgi:hypothetical protein
MTAFGARTARPRSDRTAHNVCRIVTRCVSNASISLSTTSKVHSYRGLAVPRRRGAGIGREVPAYDSARRCVSARPRPSGRLGRPGRTRSGACGSKHSAMVAFRLGRSSISHRVHLANSSNARPRSRSISSFLDPCPAAASRRLFTRNGGNRGADEQAALYVGCRDRVTPIFRSRRRWLASLHLISRCSTLETTNGLP